MIPYKFNINKPTCNKSHFWNMSAICSPHPVGIFCTIPEPPKCHIMQQACFVPDFRVFGILQRFSLLAPYWPPIVINSLTRVVLEGLLLYILWRAVGCGGPGRFPQVRPAGSPSPEEPQVPQMPTKSTRCNVLILNRTQCLVLTKTHVLFLNKNNRWILNNNYVLLLGKTHVLSQLTKDNVLL